MALSIRVTQRARRDLADILNYLREKASDEVARRVVRRIAEHLPGLGRFPGSGRNRDELQPGLRSTQVWNYLIFYRLDGEAISIVRVLHGARNLNRVFRRSRRRGRREGPG